jgi:competence protein ComEC
MLLPFLAFCWLLGFATVAAWDAPWWLAGVSLVALLPVAVWRRPEWTRALAGGAVLATVASAWLGIRTDEPPSPPAPFGEDITIEGTIASEPDPSLRFVSYRVVIEHVQAPGGGWMRGEGAILVILHQYAEFLPGDRVVVTGELQEPTDDLDGFDYRAYLLSQGITATMFPDEVSLLDEGAPLPGRVSTRVRLALEEALEHALPEPEASLGAGIAVGRDDGLPRDLRDDYRDSGLAHLTAVSGGNVAILSAIVFWFCVPLLGRYRASIPATAILAAYVLAAGFELTIVRSSLMAGVYLLGVMVGRPQSGLPGLAAVVMLMTLLDPRIVTDVGFQLSAAATAGLIVLSPWVRAACDWLLRRAALTVLAGGVVSEGLALTLSATVATLPIVAFTFERVSLIGFVANVAAGPLFLAAFPLSLATALLGLVHPDAGYAMGLGAYYPLAATNWLARTSADVPFASVSTPGISATWALLVAGAWMAAGAWLYLRPLPDRAERPGLQQRRLVRRGSLAALAGGVALWAGAAACAPMGGPGELEIHMLDVGQGDAVLLRMPGGENVLIDGGPSAQALMVGLGEALPHWERTLDLVILTHTDEDHLAGLVEAARRYEIGQVITSGEQASTVPFDLFEAENERLQAVAAGDAFSIGEARFDVLWPPAAGFGDERDTNDRSLVLRVTYGDAVVLFTGDIESAAQLELIRRESVAAQV